MFRDSFREALVGYEDFWERRNRRPILNFSYTKPDAVPFPAAKTLQEQWLDESYCYAAYWHRRRHNGYTAEGYPHYFSNFGPGSLAACIGGSYRLAPSSVWYDTVPLVTDWENPPEIRFRQDSEMWGHIRRSHAYFARDPETHYGLSDIGGVMDVVASLRGTQDLLYDLYDYPEEVKAFAHQVTEAWLTAFDREIELIRLIDQPCNSWMPIPSSKPWYPLQCDFCYMISPDQFREFVLEDLKTQAAHMERSIYHLDGPGELPHLDMILGIENLTGIQWTAGAGNALLTDETWFPLYRKIQDAGKNLVLLDSLSEGDVPAAERLIKSLDPTGLTISAHFSCQKEAEKMAERIEAWCR